MSYAAVEDIQKRMMKTLSEDEMEICSVLLEDAAVMIDAYNPDADADIKALVSCKMVLRAVSDLDGSAGIPIGAQQGSMSALGYSQSWTLGNGSTGELYISKAEKKLLGYGNKIGSYSPAQEYVPEVQA